MINYLRIQRKEDLGVGIVREGLHLSLNLLSGPEWLAEIWLGGDSKKDIVSVRKNIPTVSLGRGTILRTIVVFILVFSCNCCRFSKHFEGVNHEDILWKRVFQSEGKANRRVLRRELVLSFWSTKKRSVWLEQIKQWGEEMRSESSRGPNHLESRGPFERTSAFFLSVMGNHWRILNRGVTGSFLDFEEVLWLLRE